jgi:predicted transcriptional regulator
MPKPRPPLKPAESRILKALLEHDYSLNTTQISHIANVSWNTADQYLKKFKSNGWVIKRKRGIRIYWEADRGR